MAISGFWVDLAAGSALGAAGPGLLMYSACLSTSSSSGLCGSFS